MGSTPREATLLQGHQPGGRRRTGRSLSRSARPEPGREEVIALFATRGPTIIMFTCCIIETDWLLCLPLKAICPLLGECLLKNRDIKQNGLIA